MEWREQTVANLTSCFKNEPFPLTTPQWSGKEARPDLRVTYSSAEMVGKSYLLARVGHIFGSPAPILLLQPHVQRESAFFRLLDQFRIGEQGQSYKDFVEFGRKQGKAEAGIRAEWLACEQAVLSERYRPSGGH